MIFITILSIILMAEQATPDEWVSLRQAIGSALFITFFFYMIPYWYALIKQEEKPIVYINMNDVASKMYLYGLGILMSINYNQSGVFQAVFAYITMVCVAFLIIVNIRSSTS